jgi:hypothetical protein
MIPGVMKLIKFSDTECGLCHKMSYFDSQVATSLGIEFEQIFVGSVEFERFSDFLVSLYDDDKESIGWPSYVLFNVDTGKYVALGIIKGALPKTEFRKGLLSFYSTDSE